MGGLCGAGKEASVRFSKATVAAEIQVRIDAIQTARRFDPGNGTAQLMPGDVDRAVDYGRWMALRDIAEEYDLDVDPRDPRWWRPT